MPDTYLDLLAAYGAVWGLVVFFVLRLMSEQRLLANEIERLKAAANQPSPRIERVARVG